MLWCDEGQQGKFGLNAPKYVAYPQSRQHVYGNTKDKHPQRSAVCQDLDEVNKFACPQFHSLNYRTHLCSNKNLFIHFYLKEHQSVPTQSKIIVTGSFLRSLLPAPVPKTCSG